ncbi:uncharacterized protein BcabD6B2_54590 [Babesia caballi]|uniref:Uncharacterized protein n=1 Tax=Babesia caballi TaxID=5871 RepID=A0AAV4M1H0_BABCB|nr:hypothetical protein, conserved [Babesia caballi]
MKTAFGTSSSARPALFGRKLHVVAVFATALSLLGVAESVVLGRDGPGSIVAGRSPEVDRVTDSGFEAVPPSALEEEKAEQRAAAETVEREERNENSYQNGATNYTSGAPTAPLKEFKGPNAVSMLEVGGATGSDTESNTSNEESESNTSNDASESNTSNDESESDDGWVEDEDQDTTVNTPVSTGPVRGKRVPLNGFSPSYSTSYRHASSYVDGSEASSLSYEDSDDIDDDYYDGIEGEGSAETSTDDTSDGSEGSYKTGEALLQMSGKPNALSDYYLKSGLAAVQPSGEERHHKLKKAGRIFNGVTKTGMEYAKKGYKNVSRALMEQAKKAEEAFARKQRKSGQNSANGSNLRKEFGDVSV